MQVCISLGIFKLPIYFSVYNIQKLKDRKCFFFLREKFVPSFWKTEMQVKRLLVSFRKELLRILK
jgi:hypothetical protein